MIAAAALFLAVTAVKFLLPQQAEAFCGGLHGAMERGEELRAAMVTLGEKLTAEEGELAAALGVRRETPPEPTAELAPEPEPTPTPAAPYSPEELPALREARKAKLGKPPAAATPSPEPSTEPTPPPPEPEPSPEPTNEARERFLSAQSAFSDYALPANVSYEMPALGVAYVSPVSGVSSSGFGYRVHPITGEVKFHYGTDFAVWSGTEVCCFADGNVVFAGEESGYGKYLIVDHAGGCRTLYAHCSALLVSAGEQVTAGQTIAKSGDTGRVTGPHLHFELQKDGAYLNPEYYVGLSG